MAIPQLLVHDRKDNVGVVVVEDVTAGEELLAVVTEDNSEFRIAALDDVPIGHKIALRDLAEGDTAMKYGQTLGRWWAQFGEASMCISTISRPSAGEADHDEVRDHSSVAAGDGRVGVRNHVVVLPVDDISNAAAEGVARIISGTLALPHAYPTAIRSGSRPALPDHDWHRSQPRMLPRQL